MDHKPRPTYIYWLFDTRPETVAEHPNGLPFYCGKTVLDPVERLSKHHSTARRYPNRAVSKRILECKDHVRMQIMETTPACDNWRDQEQIWIEREKFWIYTLHLLYTNTTNIAQGGQGPTGRVHTQSARAKMSATKTGKKREPFSDEWCLKISDALKGRKFSSEHKAKIAAALTGRKPSIETRAKMAIAARNRCRKSRQEHAS